MSWLADDPELLDFALDMLENWQDQPVHDDLAKTFEPQPPPANDQAPVVEKPPKKKKNRGRRREEIIALRSQVTTLEDTLGSLKLQNQAKAEAASTVVAWENLAKRELRARRHAEDKNVWLHTTLARHVKITQRLLRLVAKRSSVQTPRPASAPSSPVKEQQPPATSNAPAVTVDVIDHANECIVEIRMRSTWVFTNSSTQEVEAALWTLYRADRQALTHFSVDYEILAASDTSVQSGFTIRSSDGIVFRGTQLASCSRDGITGQFLLQSKATVVPIGCSTDSVLDAAQMDEETFFRVGQDQSTGSSVVAIDRQFIVRSSKATQLQRRGLADAVSVHLKEEQQWMREVVEQRLEGDNTRVERLLTPPQDVQLDTAKPRSAG